MSAIRGSSWFSARWNGRILSQGYSISNINRAGYYYYYYYPYHYLAPGGCGISSMERAGVRDEFSASRFSSSTGFDKLVATMPLLVVAIEEQPGGSLATTLKNDDDDD